MRQNIDVLLGLQWGDEGKGKVVDVLTPNYDVVARFQGGPNAGHTLEFEGQKYVLRSIPSGIFQGDKVKELLNNNFTHKIESNTWEIILINCLPVIIIISSLNSETVTKNALRLGASYYLIKPFQRFPCCHVHN